MQQKPLPATFGTTVKWFAASDDRFTNYHVQSLRPWVDATNLDLLGNTRDVNQNLGQGSDRSRPLVEQNNYDPSLVLTRYAPFYPREFKQLSYNTELDTNSESDNRCNTSSNDDDPVCDGSDDANYYNS